MDDDAAVFVEPLAAAFQVVKQLGTNVGSPLHAGRQWVTVLGDGRLGLLSWRRCSATRGARCA